MSFLTRAASGGIVGGASSLSTAGSIAYVASAGVLGQDPTFARSNPGRYTLYDSTPTTGVTTFTIRVGSGQTTNVLTVLNAAGTQVIAMINGSGDFISGAFAAQTSGGLQKVGGYTSGLRVASDVQVLFASTTSATDVPDLGLARDAAGRLRVSNGSTGLGSIMIASSTPSSAAATGAAGTIAWDANYIYVCTAANTWKRVAIATW